MTAPTSGAGLLYRERSLLVCGLLVFALLIVLCDAYLLHRTEQFFGGGALNRPFALVSPTGVIAFLGLSFGYDFLLYATLGMAIAISGLCQKRLNPAQRLVLVFYALASIACIAFFTRWQLYMYFKNRFDPTIMLDLMDERPTYLLSFVDSMLLVVALLALGSLVVLLLLLRVLKPAATAIAPWRPRRSIAVLLLIAWVVLAASHFVTAADEPLRFGLSKKLSYSAVNLPLEMASDLDGDGFSALSRPTDPDWLNPAVQPYAIDHPGNQIDENGLAGDLPRMSLEGARREIRCIERSNGSNVLLAVIETFRTDVVNREIEGREITPFLNEMARTHAYTDQMYSNFGVTSRAIQSIMTGSLHYAERPETLAHALRRFGYKTIVVSGQDESWGGTDEVLGFEEYDSVFDARDVDWSAREITYFERANKFARTLMADEINEKVLHEIEKYRDEKWFMYVNYQDLHYPYFDDRMQLFFIDEGKSGSGFFRSENREKIWRQYANAAHHLDGALARLWRSLTEMGLHDRTVMVVVGDHPDSFYENGLLGHAWTVDEHQRRTPFLIVNGQGVYTLPMGQDEVADAVLNSVERGAGQKRASFVVDPSKRIFGLTGELERPRQIAWMSIGDLATYDFMTGRWQLGEAGPWRAPSQLLDRDPEHELFLALVHRWESEVLLRGAAVARGDEQGRDRASQTRAATEMEDATSCPARA